MGAERGGAAACLLARSRCRPHLLHARTPPALGGAMNRALPRADGSPSHPGGICLRASAPAAPQGPLSLQGCLRPSRPAGRSSTCGSPARRPNRYGKIDPPLPVPARESRQRCGACRRCPMTARPTHRRESTKGGIKANPEPAGMLGLPGRGRPPRGTTGAMPLRPPLRRGAAGGGGQRQGRTSPDAWAAPPQPSPPPAGAWQGASPLLFRHLRPAQAAPPAPAARALSALVDQLSTELDPLH